MKKILIVDDDKLSTTVLEKFLSMQGYETAAVNDSLQAVHTALTLNPDLIVLDLVMPDPGLRRK